jgi:hypothetical protein
LVNSFLHLDEREELFPPFFAIRKAEAPRPLALDSSQSSMNEGGTSLQIIQTVVVKQILTENSKEKLFDHYQVQKQQLQKECSQLQFELKRMEKTKNFSPGALKNHFEKEINKRLEKEKLLDFQIEQLHILPLGSELKEKEVQALVEVKIGDIWDERIGQSTIIINDGIIEDIR